MKFYFTVRGDRITKREDYSFVEGNRQVYEAVFEFDEYWKNEDGEDRFDRMCIVYNNGIKGLPVPITKNEDGEWMCRLPLLANGSAKVGVVGVDGEEDSICPRISTNWANVNVGKGAANDDTTVDIDKTVAEIWEQYYLQMAEKADAAETAAENADTARDEAYQFSVEASSAAGDAIAAKELAEIFKGEAEGFSNASIQACLEAESYRDESLGNAAAAEDAKTAAETAAGLSQTYSEQASIHRIAAQKQADSIKNLSVEAVKGEEAGVTKSETDDGIMLSFTLPKGEDGYTPQKGVDYFTQEDIEELNIPVVDSELNADSENAVQNRAVAGHINTLYAESANLHTQAESLNTEISGINSREKSLKYYGDADIVPSDESLFSFTVNDETMTASVSANPELMDNSIYELTISGDIVIPYKYNVNGKTYTVNSINGSAFARGCSITGVVLPNTIKAIGESAFQDCFSLQYANIPLGITSISSLAFAYCSQWTKITIPDSVKTIDAGAFAACDSITDVYYRGTKAQWDAIEIGNDNGSLPNATVHYEWSEAMEVDTELSTDSENPVQNKVIAVHINTLLAETGNLMSEVSDIRSENSEIRELNSTQDMEIAQLMNDVSSVHNDVMQHQNTLGALSVEKADVIYVDEKIGDIETALDSIIAIQNTLIGGESV